jgi:hypothetical protein
LPSLFCNLTLLPSCFFFPALKFPLLLGKLSFALTADRFSLRNFFNRGSIPFNEARFRKEFALAGSTLPLIELLFIESQCLLLRSETLRKLPEILLTAIELLLPLRKLLLQFAKPRLELPQLRLQL